MSEQDYVKIIESFRTWQGEGPCRGISTLLLRFKTCNLSCPWCDTSVRMRVLKEMVCYLEDVQQEINKSDCGLLITGGEPTVERHFNDAFKLLNFLEYPIANMETNGYKLREFIDITDENKNIKYIYSPKIFNGNDLSWSIDLTRDILDMDNVYVKIVYEERDLIEDYLEFLTRCGINRQRVYLMPEGATYDQLMKNAPVVFDKCEQYQFNFSSRDHIIFGFV